MATAAAVRADLERQLRMLQELPEARVITTCYLDVDGRVRPRMLDCLAAFAVLAQQAARLAQAREPALQEAVEHALMRMRRWLEHDLERSRTRGVALVAVESGDTLHAVTLPVPVRDQVAVSGRASLLQLEAVLAEARTYGIALVDGERLRMLEYRLGQLLEYPALFEGPSPQRDRQHAWTVTGSTAASGHDAARWQPAGSHVDRHEVRIEEHHIAACAAALGAHLDRHPVDHLLLGGPKPERARLERELPERHRARVAGEVSVRVAAPLSEIHDAVLETFRDIEERDEDAALDRLSTALGTGRAVGGLEAVRAAIDAGRVAELVLPGAGGGDALEEVIARAAGTGATVHFIRFNPMPAGAEGIAAITRF